MTVVRAATLRTFFFAFQAGAKELMLNHKTVLEWSIAKENFLQYAIVIGKFYCTTRYLSSN